MNYISAINFSSFNEHISYLPEKERYNFDHSVKIEVAEHCKTFTQESKNFGPWIDVYESKKFISNQVAFVSSPFISFPHVFYTSLQGSIKRSGLDVIRKDGRGAFIVRHQQKKLRVAYILYVVRVRYLAKLLDARVITHLTPSSTEVFLVDKVNRLAHSAFRNYFTKQYKEVEKLVETLTLKKISSILFQGRFNHECPFSYIPKDICHLIISLSAESLSPQESTQIAIKHFSRPELGLKGRITSFVRKLLS